MKKRPSAIEHSQGHSTQKQQKSSSVLGSIGHAVGNVAHAAKNVDHAVGNVNHALGNVARVIVPVNNMKKIVRGKGTKADYIRVGTEAAAWMLPYGKLFKGVNKVVGGATLRGAAKAAGGKTATKAATKAVVKALPKATVRTTGKLAGSVAMSDASDKAIGKVIKKVAKGKK